jgi:hypothetical protein
MSLPPKPPERLAEILQEILALANSIPTKQSESVSRSDPIELVDSNHDKEQSQGGDQENRNRQTS